ncbi:MAG: hypothetical protein EOO01_11120 [Chitinophagaceae bacterium]|nr:MAG: hypothetical protein EOO01_11120 [Chitinophagaceae bacterium]
MKSALLIALISLPGFIRACPICNSLTGNAIRASVLGPDLWFNLAVLILPFAIFAIVAAIMYYGIRPPRSHHKTQS